MPGRPFTLVKGLELFKLPLLVEGPDCGLMELNSQLVNFPLSVLIKLDKSKGWGVRVLDADVIHEHFHILGLLDRNVNTGDVVHDVLGGVPHLDLGSSLFVSVGVDHDHEGLVVHPEPVHDIVGH